MRCIAAVLLALVGVSPHALASVSPQGWKAGTARVNITPTAPMWMSGYPSDHPAEGKLQDLWAKALVVEDAKGQRAVLITMDVIGIDRPTSQRICEQLVARHGFERRQIALCASHTHCGPAVGRNLEGMLVLDD